MAVVTWDGSSSTAYSTAANWDTGSVPGDGDDVVIPDTSSINACNVDSNDSCNSLTVSTNGEIGSDSGSKLTILGEADGTGATTDGYAVKIDGVITDNTTTSLDLDMRTPATTLIDIVPTSGSLRNLVINHASFIGTFLGNTSISGNLTINSGELKSAGSNSLTVTGRIDIASGGTLTCNSSAVSSAGGVTVTGTLNAPDASGSLTISGEHSNRVIDVVGTFNNNDGTITITYAVQSQIRWPSTSNPHSLVINHASADIRLAGNMDTAGSREFEGNVTITAGILSTLDVDGSQNHNLTVTGDVDISGTLTCNASAVSFGSLKCQASSTLTATSGTTTITSENSSGQAIVMNNSMTFNNSDGTFLITTPAATNIYFKSENALHHLTINHSSADIVLAGNPDDLKCEGDLTITAGILRATTSGATLEVDGDASVTGTLNWSGTSGGAVELGSLTINSGGTYSATSGTTTITSESGAGNAILNSGTFTHNKGTVAIDTDATTQANEGPYYNLKTTRASLDFYPNAALTILNNLDIVGDFDFQNNSHHLTVRGNMTVGDGSTTTRYGQQSANTNNLTVDGVLTILGSATADLGTHTTVNLGGIRNVGGTIN